MSEIEELLKKLKLSTASQFNDLAGVLEVVSGKIKEFNSDVKLLKIKETEIKNLIMGKLAEQKLKSVKTAKGTFTPYTAESVNTDDATIFTKWLRESVLLEFCEGDITGDLKADLKIYLRREDHTDTLHLLSKSPYLKAAVVDYAGAEKVLPPGLKWYREVKLSVTKSETS